MAKTTLQELVVKFTGDTRGLDYASDKASRAINGVSKSAINAGTVIKGMIAAISVQQIYGAATATLNWADDLGDLAQTLGVTTEKVQALQYAAIANGSSIGEVNAAMLRFTAAVGDAATAGGPLVDRMKELGIYGLDANGQLLNIEQLLPQVANAIQKATSAQEKLSIATDFFGRSAAPSMVRLLGEGAQKLTELEQAARDAGAVLSDEVVKAAAETNAKFELLVQTIGVRLKGAVLDGIDIMSSLGDAAFAAGEKVSRALGYGSLGAIPDTNTYNPTREQRDKFLEEDRQRVSVPEEEVLAIPLNNNRYIPQRESSGRGGRGGRGSTDNRTSKDIASDAVKAISDLEKMAKKAGPAVAGVKNEMIRLDNATQDMREQIGSTFSDFTMSVARGEDALESLRRVALNVISDIAENMLTMSYGGKSGGGIAGAAAGVLGDVIGGFFGGKSSGKVPAFATGINRVAQTGLAVVHAGEKITPARDSRNSNGGGVNQTINISTGVQQTVRAEIQRMLPQLKMAAVGGVQNARQRGMIGAV